MLYIIATRNQHKVGEIRSILGIEHEYLSLTDFPDAPEVHEDVDTFEGNARKKAVEIAEWIQSRTGILPVVSREEKSEDRQDAGPTFVLADDSGLEVDALNGAPGVYSARYAGKQADYAANNRKLLAELKNVPDPKRTARFRCVIAAVEIGAGGSRTAPAIAVGSCEGRIIHEERGIHGFGYDPLFVPDGHTLTLAELGSDVKDKISHRARALAEAKKWLAAHDAGSIGSRTSRQA